MNLAVDAAAFLARRRLAVGGRSGRSGHVIVERRALGRPRPAAIAQPCAAAPAPAADPSLADDIAAIIRTGGFPRRLM